jgi:alkaline phosphatase
MARSRFVLLLVVVVGLIGLRNLFSATTAATVTKSDFVRDMQKKAMKAKKADWGYWGASAKTFSGWTSHSNRLIPVYTFGMDLSSVAGENSVYRSKERLENCTAICPRTH